MTRSATRAATRTINPALAWAPALIVSAFVHTMMVAVLKEAVEPDPIPFTEEIRTRISMSSMKVPAHRAEAQEVESEAAEAAATGGERLGVQSVPSNRARPIAPAGQSLAALAPVAGPRIPAIAAAAEDMAAVAPASAPVAATAPSGTAVPAASLAAQTIAPAESRGQVTAPQLRTSYQRMPIVCC